MGSYDNTYLGVENRLHPANEIESDYEPTQEELLLDQIDDLERKNKRAQEVVFYLREKLEQINELTSGNLSVDKIKSIIKIVEPYKKTA